MPTEVGLEYKNNDNNNKERAIEHLKSLSKDINTAEFAVEVIYLMEVLNLEIHNQIDSIVVELPFQYRR
jgi:hypothetical protein